MRDFFQGDGRRKLIDWLAIDSWIDSGLYNAWIRLRDWMSAYSTFFGRFEARGPWKLLNELACEALTLGTGGFLVVAAFALPAFHIAQGKINLSDEYTVTFLDRYGNEIGKRGLLRDNSVPLDQIPDNLIKATLATEDRRFFEHFGIDVMGTLRALIQNAQADAVVQGGSSLTQQLAKNMFLSPQRSLSRKIKEAFIAIYLETHYTKKEILKLYFDRAYLGGGSYGVEAAAQFYFGKSVRDLDLAECAMIAGMFKAPTKYAPHVNLAASRARADQVLDNMVEAGYLTEGQAYYARMHPASIVERPDYYTPDWFLDYAYDEVRRILKGKPQHIVVARTTVDIPMQKMAEQAVKDTVTRYGPSRHFDQGALVAMTNDGAVRALVGGKDYGESQFNRATHAYRQPGSSFKPYVYLTALQNGYTPDTVVSGYGAHCGNWSPHNYAAGESNSMRMIDALAHSINTIAVKVSLDVGRDKILANLRKMGITNVHKTCSMALGDTGLTPLEHTGGYAVFASGGLNVKPYGIEQITTPDGKVLYSHDRDAPPLKRIFKLKYIEELNTMLRAVVTDGTGRRAQLPFANNVGKTGTSSDWRDGWFMGFDGQYVVGVWLGNDDFTPMARVTGGSFPAQTWYNFMVMTHDTDNIPPIPGVPPSPSQIAAEQRLALDPGAVQPTAASLMEMQPATRELLQNIGTLLKQAPRLSANAKRAETVWPADTGRSSADRRRAENTDPPSPVSASP
jgi:penicillin-binding protein 1A